MQVVACTPDAAIAEEVNQASKAFPLRGHLICKVGNIDLQVSATMIFVGGMAIWIIKWEISASGIRSTVPCEM